MGWQLQYVELKECEFKVSVLRPVENNKIFSPIQGIKGPVSQDLLLILLTVNSPKVFLYNTVIG